MRVDYCGVDEVFSNKKWIGDAFDWNVLWEFSEKAQDVSRTAIITYRYHPQPPPPPHSYKNAFPDGDIRATQMKHSDKTHRTSLDALARGFGKEKKGNYHASKSDFR